MSDLTPCPACKGETFRQVDQKMRIVGYECVRCSRVLQFTGIDDDKDLYRQGWADAYLAGWRAAKAAAEALARPSYKRPRDWNMDDAAAVAEWDEATEIANQIRALPEPENVPENGGKDQA